MARSSDEGRRTEIVNTRFTPGQVRLMEEAAKDERITVSVLIRRAVVEYLWNDGAYKPAEVEPEA